MATTTTKKTTSSTKSTTTKATTTKTTKKEEAKEIKPSKPKALQEKEKAKSSTKTTSAKKEETKEIKPSKPKALQAKESTDTQTKHTGKQIYHVTKRTNDENDREWKVFIQVSNKVIKIFKTQAEALEYAKKLRADKDTTVMLHGLDGKIRKY